MDPGLAEQSSPETKKIVPALIDLSDNVQKPNHDGDTSGSDSDSDTSDGDDFFQLDPIGLGDPIKPVHSPQKPAQTTFDPLDENVDLSTKYASRSQIEGQVQAQSSEFRPTQTPPLPPTMPVAVRNDVPDPSRIPSSVFARTKSTSPMEWSVASNESLFSIHMGNSSFSTDNVFLMGRSGELGNFSSTGMDGNPTPPLSPIGSPLPLTVTHMSPLPPLIPSPACALPQPTPSVSSNLSGLDMGHGLDKPRAAETTNANAMKDVSRATVEEQNSDKDKSDPDAGHFSKSISRQSDGSTASFRSFAFPILTGDGVRSGSLNTEPEHQQMQSQNAEQQTPKIADKEKAAAAAAAAPAPAAAPASSHAPATTEEAKGSLSCFSCCSFCC